MKNKILGFLLLFLYISVFAENQDFLNARQLAENGFWNESLVELKKVPKSQKNSDYQLLEAFAKVMTNQASSKDENYISAESPAGKAIMGKKEGEVVQVEAPGGVFSYQIAKIIK